jgi:DNA-directed RNA polymerase subunit F
MGTQEILNKTPLSLAEVKGKLSTIKKRDEELNFRTNKVVEYISSYHIIAQKDAKELYEKLEALDVSRLRDVQIKKIVDILPESEDDLKTIMTGYSISLSSDNVKKVLDAVKPYLPKKK